MTVGAYDFGAKLIELEREVDATLAEREASMGLVAALQAELAELKEWKRQMMHDTCNGFMRGDPPKYVPECVEYKAELAQARKDAERYRWLRSFKAVPSPSLWDSGIGFFTPTFPRKSRFMELAELDAAIDAALLADKEPL